jgi:hypothetical protein
MAYTNARLPIYIAIFLRHLLTTRPHTSHFLWFLEFSEFALFFSVSLTPCFLRPPQLSLF